VAFLGCRPAFWGDISGVIVGYLASKCGVKQVIYFGKLGVTCKGIPPNTYLANGSRSYVCGKVIEWDNFLKGSVAEVAGNRSIEGDHISLGSVLHETKDWLAQLPKSVSFVDPEIGMMASAAKKNGVQFSYLHIISDNVAEKYEHDLSNERLESVLKGRAKLYSLAQDVLRHYLLSVP
jgi:hypothetical protein